MRNPLILRHLRQHADLARLVLDIGCGRGVAVQYLRQAGLDCRGVELAHVKPMPGIEDYVRYGIDAMTIPARDRSRCVTILLLDVIEHLNDPVSFLCELTAAYENLDQLVVTVPARPEVWSHYDVFFGHHRRYTLPMVASLSSAVGWPVTSQRYFFHSLYLAARLIKVARRDRSVAVHAPDGQAVWLHRILAWLLTLENRIMPSRVPGLSILFSLQRPRR